MSEGNDEAIECLICYELVDRNKTIQFTKCSHIFCEYCFNEIIFENQVLCPLDRQICNNISIHSSDGSLIQKSILEYLTDLVNYFPHFILNEIYKCLSNFIPHFDKLIKQQAIFLYSCKNQIQCWLTTKSEVDFNEFINQLARLEKDFFSQTKMELKENIDYPLKKINTYLFSLCKISNENSFNLEEKILKIQKQFISFKKLTLYRIVNNNFDYSKINEIDFVNSSLNVVKSDINCLEVLSKHLIKLLICFIENNGVIYGYLQTKIDATNKDNCLICLKSIETAEFAKFVDCDHKICIKCFNISRFMKASCPFEEKFSDIVLNQHENLSCKFVSCYFKYIYKQKKYLKKIVSEICSLNINFPNLIDNINEIFYSDDESISILISNIFDQSEHLKFVKTYELNLLKIEMCFDLIQSKIKVKNELSIETYQLIKILSNFLQSFMNFRSHISFLKKMKNCIATVHLRRDILREFKINYKKICSVTSDILTELQSLYDSGQISNESLHSLMIDFQNKMK